MGEDWKRHRRVAGPAFNATTYRNVWDETSRIYDELVQTAGWADVKQVTIDDVGLITRKAIRSSYGLMQRI
jgi:cytochrome P450